MSRDGLDRLERGGALASTRRYLDYPLYHVPFDKLIGDPRTEARIARAAHWGQRVALVGRSGAGKSSVLATVLDPFGELPESIMPVRIGLGANQEEIVTQPRRFAQYLIAVLVEGVGQLGAQEREEFRRAASDREQRPGRERIRRLGLRLPVIASPELAQEMREVGQAIDRERGGGEFLEQARRLFDTVRAHGVTPLLVFDDTDSWFGGRGHLADQFFGETLRVAARELDCGLVAAVHPEYQSLAGYERAKREILPVQVEVPRLPGGQTAGAIGRILERAMRVHEVTQSLEELFPRSTIEGLAWHYASHARLRDVISVAGRAVQLSCEASAERVTPEAVAQAINELTRDRGG